MDVITNWLSENQEILIFVAVVLISTLVIKHFSDAMIHRVVRRTIKGGRSVSRAEEKKREDTVVQILSGALHILIWPTVAIIIISRLGVNIAPLIAGAGIVGLAVGFGAQSLVKDVISGLFIIIENQYRVGDVVQLGDTSGIIERISLRVTVMRDLDGVVHTIPNGTIEKTSNFTKEYSSINLNVRVVYDTDIDKAIKTINEVGDRLAKDEEWAEKFIEAPQFLRVDNFAESAIEMKIIGKVQPLTQWEIMGEMRKRLKSAFDKNGIVFALPQHVIHQAKKSQAD